MSKDRVAIFGGSGYVGDAVSRFMKEEFEVAVADIRPPRSLQGVEFVECDVRDFGQVRRALSGAAAALYFSVIQIPQINAEKRLGYEVNVLGLQNVCEAALQTPSTKGVLHSGTWHVFGERGLSGIIDESFGFRPDKVEDRAKVYTLCKIVQECVVRLYDEMGASAGKKYGVIRMGTVLGENMSEHTAAALFIKNGLNGKPLTPYKSSMHRPMLYVDIIDICRSCASFVRKLLKDEGSRREEGIPRIVNLVWPEPITVLELANLVKDAIKEKTSGRIDPLIEVKDTGDQPYFAPGDKNKFKVDPRKAKEFLGSEVLTNPRASIRRIVEKQIAAGRIAVSSS